MADSGGRRTDGVVTVRLAEAQWTPVPEYGGAVWEVHRSADGRTVIAAFRESGSFSFTYPFDEFLHVVRGTLSGTVRGGSPLHLEAGDSAYIPRGTTVDFTISDDFMDITLLRCPDGPVEF